MAYILTKKLRISKVINIKKCPNRETPPFFEVGIDKTHGNVSI